MTRDERQRALERQFAAGVVRLPGVTDADRDAFFEAVKAQGASGVVRCLPKGERFDFVLESATVEAHAAHTRALYAQWMREDLARIQGIYMQPLTAEAIEMLTKLATRYWRRRWEYHRRKRNRAARTR